MIHYGADGDWEAGESGASVLVVFYFYSRVQTVSCPNHQGFSCQSANRAGCSLCRHLGKSKVCRSLALFLTGARTHASTQTLSWINLNYLIDITPVLLSRSAICYRYNIRTYNITFMCRKYYSYLNNTVRFIYRAWTYLIPLEHTLATQV